MSNPTLADRLRAMQQVYAPDPNTVAHAQFSECITEAEAHPPGYRISKLQMRDLAHEFVRSGGFNNVPEADNAQKLMLWLQDKGWIAPSEPPSGVGVAVRHIEVAEKMLTRIVNSSDLLADMPRDWMALAEKQKELAGTALSAVLGLRGLMCPVGLCQCGHSPEWLDKSTIPPVCGRFFGTHDGVCLPCEHEYHSRLSAIVGGQRPLKDGGDHPKTGAGLSDGSVLPSVEPLRASPIPVAEKPHHPGCPRYPSDGPCNCG